MKLVDIRHDLRKFFGPVRDQGARQTCLAFATSDVHASRLGSPWNPLSCEYLFFHAKARDGTPPSAGTTVSAVRDAVEIDGQPAESGWPYIASLPNNLQTWLPPSNPGKLYFRNSQLLTSSFGSVWDAIETGKPVVVGMSYTDDLYFPDLSNVVGAAAPLDPTLRHAVIGVATGMLAATRHILVRNSWGPSWGDLGYAWLSEIYLGPRVLAAFTLA